MITKTDRVRVRDRECALKATGIRPGWKIMNLQNMYIFQNMR
jgi:hypothetical protein